MLLLQEFDVEVKDRVGSVNHVADYLSRLPLETKGVLDYDIICDSFPDQSLFALSASQPGFAHLVNYIATGLIPSHLTTFQAQKLKSKASYYIWDPPHLWRLYSDQVIRRCIPEVKGRAILEACHDTLCGGTSVLEKQLGRWVEAIPTRKDDAPMVSKFLKFTIFSRFGVPKVLISDQGTHFCNKLLNNLLAKYGVSHKVSTPSHPQTNGLAEVSNREIKRILEQIVKPSNRDWSLLLGTAFSEKDLVLSKLVRAASSELSGFRSDLEPF
ncbi:uncharacterized protein LOC114752882 [Neltuma alba]|uniref:uncharacterized protein LOC114752882 n=1 Tax=Neltuma alba TaxID=207710 RepID=UPI0010A3D243|nr:uncharacterized protein LOC114752882 [Prosopis alba]